LFPTCLFTGALAAQEAVPLASRHERILAIVPLHGAGTKADPRRPAFAPPPDAVSDERGILAYSCQTSDDNQWALCEFAARNRAAFQALYADRTPGIVIFEKGRATREQIETAFRRLKRNLDLDQIKVLLP
jgi:hypothetical protein